MECLNELPDPRKPSNGTRHDFREILVIAICAMLSDSDSFDDIALWGRLKESWLRRFLRLQNGIPSQDCFLRVFRALDPTCFESVFRPQICVQAVGVQPGGKQTNTGEHFNTAYCDISPSNVKPY